MKKKTATVTKPATVTPGQAPTSAPFLAHLFASIARSDPNGVDSFAHMIALADRHVEPLITRGVFGDEALQATIAVLIPEYEQARDTEVSYTADVARLEAVQGTADFEFKDADRILDVRMMEKEAAFALGVALGLRCGGAR